MKNMFTHSLLLVALATLFLGAPCVASAQADILDELDRTIDATENFVKARNANIRNIESRLSARDLTSLQQYNIYYQLFLEYRSFQFDNAMAMLEECHRLAESMGSRVLLSDVQIERAMLFATAGMFFEAGEILANEIDTTCLDATQRINYYNAQQRFHSDFWHYTNDHETRERSGHKIRYYRTLILQNTPDTAPLHRYVTVRNLCDSGKWEQAEQINSELLSNYTNDEHEFAMYAYDRARICEAMERSDEMVEWFARSAMADIRTATKDNASLCSLAQSLLGRDDIDRAFRYITISLSDALYYNAKLRPWQISAIIPEIERAYQAKQQLQGEEIRRQEMRARHLAVIISVLAVALMCICGYMALLLRRSRKYSHKICEMNERIGHTNNELQQLNERMGEINSELREANAVKEEYIALFLSMCSDYIEKLMSMQRGIRRKLSQGKLSELESELSSSSLMDEELNNFYEMFDNAFLQLYPNFVEEFNMQLKPESRIHLKNGERLNTELRIFALIRLGITDSSRIASLLRYSVNTIYNYRARTKNNALASRDSFEERIKTIGK